VQTALKNSSRPETLDEYGWPEIESAWFAALKFCFRDYVEQQLDCTVKRAESRCSVCRYVPHLAAVMLINQENQVITFNLYGKHTSKVCALLNLSHLCFLNLS